MTKTGQRIKEAYERGYRVSEDGVLSSLQGSLKVALRGKQRYPTFGTNWGGYVYGVPVHQFAAYCFYGDLLFSEELLVRHLDGNTLNFSKSNIVMGTYSQNEHDKSPEVRHKSAKAARAAQGVAALNRKLSKNDVLSILDKLESLGNPCPYGSNKVLCEEYGVSRTTLHKLRSGKVYPEYYKEWKLGEAS